MNLLLVIKGIIWQRLLVKLGDIVKKIRDISEEERDILLNNRLRSVMPLGTLFYIMGILLPFFVCMLITLDFTYLYLLIVGLIILLFIIVIYPLIYYNHLQTAKIKCFESVILSCKMSEIYYYKVEIEGIDGEFLNYRYPVSKKVKQGCEVVVVMILGKDKVSRYLLIDKEKKKLLSSKRTRFDLV